MPGRTLPDVSTATPRTTPICAGGALDAHPTEEAAERQGENRSSDRPAHALALLGRAPLAIFFAAVFFGLDSAKSTARPTHFRSATAPARPAGST